RSRDDELDADPGGRFARETFTLDLRLLIDVSRPERRVLVGRRTLHVTVHADRAAVHDASRTGGCGRLEERHDSQRVDRAVGFGRQPGLPIQGGDVVDDLAASHGAGQVGAVREVAFDDLELVPKCGGYALRIAHQGTHRVPRFEECARQVAAGEAG